MGSVSAWVLTPAPLPQAVEQLLLSGQPLLIFLEEAPGAPGPRLSALGQAWLGLVVQAVQAGVIPDVTLVPVAIAYDLVPDSPGDVHHVSTPALGTPRGQIPASGRGHCFVMWLRLPRPPPSQAWA